MDQDTKDAIDDYYRLKNTYEAKILKARRKILRDKSLYKTAKKQALAELKVACVSCGKEGGTAFREEGTKLYASCLASKKASKHECFLDIEIDRGSFEPITKLYKINSDLFAESRVNIIKTKLDVLFGYIAEEQAVVNFGRQKEEFDISQSSLKEIHTIFANILKNDRNKKAINDTKINMAILIEQINELLGQYSETEKKSFIADAMQSYVNDLYPEAKKLRMLSYAKNAIECSDGIDGPAMCEGTYHLIQDPYLYSETEIELIKPVILKNTK